MTWGLRLLQEASLEFGGGNIPLERKTAGLLAYLSFEGATRRSLLAGLLWPNSGEVGARSNLRQLLSRLRRVAGEMVEGTDLLVLSPLAASDLRDVVGTLREGRDPRLPPVPWLLPGFDYSDCQEFFDWLSQTSRELMELQRAVLEAEADRWEASGDQDQALNVASRLLALDALSEPAHRRLIRIHYLRGDRASAIRAYRHCECILSQEVGASPMPETQELLRLVEDGAPFPSGRSPRPNLPPVILRPPRLVGRDAIWSRMEEAWEQGKLIYLSGAAGMGKSRLAADFIEAKGRGHALRLQSRLGDASVPFASQARAIRTTLAAFPGLHLPTWVRRELSRMLPDLREPGDPVLAPLREEEARLEFFQAQVELIRITGAGPFRLIFEDLQYTDEESAALGHYMFSALSGTEDSLRTVVTFRAKELSPILRQSVEERTEAGLADHIEVQPLSQEETLALVGDLGIDGLLQESDTLHALSGGNPAILLEAIKAILRAEASPAPGLPREAWALLQKRLDHLPDAALDLAQVAAIAGDLFTPQLAAFVLEVHPLRLAPAWQELEAHQFLQGTSLVHDLLKEAILAGLPRPLLSSLHERTALYLEDKGSDPISIALHWEGAGMQERAAPYLLIER